jgi:hypothetical protein
MKIPVIALFLLLGLCALLAPLAFSLAMLGH